MLQQSFCHLPRIGLQREIRLWEDGVHTWDDFNDLNAVVKHPSQLRTLQRHLDKSRQALVDRDAAFFSNALPASESWRLLPEFVGTIGYLDIETTGSLVDRGDVITTVAVYDGLQVREYIRGYNLDELVADLAQFELLVTYNGKCFDLPFIESFYGVRIAAPQVDLRFIFQSLGFKGGLKGVERQLGLDRGDLDGVDGYFAVLLWRDYEERGNRRALETLVAYNVADTVNLERLAAIAYNLKVDRTPFAGRLRMEIPELLVTSTFQPHSPTLDRLRRRYSLWK